MKKENETPTRGRDISASKSRNQCRKKVGWEWKRYLGIGNRLENRFQDRTNVLLFRNIGHMHQFLLISFLRKKSKTSRQHSVSHQQHTGKGLAMGIHVLYGGIGYENARKKRRNNRESERGEKPDKRSTKQIQVNKQSQQSQTFTNGRYVGIIERFFTVPSGPCCLNATGGGTPHHLLDHCLAELMHKVRRSGSSDPLLPSISAKLPCCYKRPEKNEKTANQCAMKTTTEQSTGLHSKTCDSTLQQDRKQQT